MAEPIENPIPTPVNPVTPTTPITPPQLWDDGTPFDPDRAKKTITSLSAKAEEGDKAIKELDRIKAETEKVEQDRLKEQGKFQELATKAETELETTKTTLATTQENLDKAYSLIDKHIEDRIKVLPPEAQKLIPAAGKATPLERIAKLEELEIMQKAFSPAKPGVNPVKNSASSTAVPPTAPATNRLKIGAF